jgi:predicted metal-dependent hydrolase
MGRYMADEYIQAAGYDVRIVRRRRMRSIRIHVHGDGSVSVSAALRASDRAICEAVERSVPWIKAQTARLAVSPMAQAEYASDADQREWRVLVEAATELLLEKWEPVIGVRVKKLAFRNMKSRWGSCQPATGRVCINIRLALYPPNCLEYVVVHELVHMLEPSHNARFHELMTQFLPGWEKTRRSLV